MTRSELIEALAERFPEQTLPDVKLSVLTILEAMSETLAKGGRIEIRGFGSFRSVIRPQRLGRNPKTGDEVEVPEKRILLFKPAYEMRERVNIKPSSARHHTRTTGSYSLQLQD